MKTFEERAEALVADMTLEEKVYQTLHGAPAIDRLERSASRRSESGYGDRVPAGDRSGRCV